jgi:hypothetical protein
MKRFVCAAAIAASAAFAAFAEDKPAARPEMPKPPDELKAEQWFVGTWNCKGKMYAGPMGPEGPIGDKLQISMDLGGFWMEVHVTPTGGPMKGKEVVNGFASWDGTQHVRYDFLIGGMAKLTSKGWDGDKIAFEGERMVGPQKQAMKHTITRKGDGEFLSAFEFDGKPVIEETCTRAAAKK